jgi:plasmid maintenance system antidote protein VapI
MPEDIEIPEPAETFHPMEYVIEELEHRGISPDMAGRMLHRMIGLKTTEWFEFIAGGPVDQRLADGLAQLFGTSAEVWMMLQRAYDRMHGTEQGDLIDAYFTDLNERVCDGQPHKLNCACPWPAEPGGH